MNTEYRLLPTAFEDEVGFTLSPNGANRETLQSRFADLKAELLETALAETETLSLRSRFKQVANEAAGLAWTTPVPLLVFPTLFQELAGKLRVRETRQSKIASRSQMIMEAAVC
ncbi:MAG: hypothetical protein ACO1QB_14615 [Verrucomicrobiales bacterium]